MAKTDTTKMIERVLYNQLNGRAVVGCHEVTIGPYGREIVDFVTVSLSKDMQIVCYEIKVSKQDFFSKAALSFVGHRNYFVLTPELWEQVKDSIPRGVGVYTVNERGGIALVKRCSIKEPSVDPSVVIHSVLRSLNRELYKALGVKPYRDYQNIGNKIIGGNK